MKNYPFILLFFLIFQGCISGGETQKNWELIRVKNLPIKTTNQAVSPGFIHHKPFLFTFGGLDSTKLYSGIHQRSFRFDLENEIWSEIPSLPDSLGKIANAASLINDTIYIIGGYHVFANGKERSSNKVHRFDVHNNVFLEDGAPIPVPIDDHVQINWKNKLIYLISGWSDKENVPNVQIYDPVKNIWLEGTPVPDNHIYKSFGASGTIIGDTIYYFGGASMGKNFPIQNYLRKGIIHAGQPNKITWSYQIIDSLTSGYRMAATQHKNKALWIGGSTNTYNYNGMAYDASGGVQPNQRILTFKDSKFNYNFNKKLPMDLRGIIDITDSLKYIVGGMEQNQKVSNKVYKLAWK